MNSIHRVLQVVEYSSVGSIRVPVYQLLDVRYSQGQNQAALLLELGQIIEIKKQPITDEKL